jgi:hypothetical protein
MKILLTLAAFVLVAVLVVSATMGAETLVPGGESNKKTPVGGLAPSSGKARILPTGFAPPSLKGTGFKPGEDVTVKVVGGSSKATRRARANGSGSFTVRLGMPADRCNGMTVTAVGDKGSRASFQFAELLCAMSGSKSP